MRQGSCVVKRARLLRRYSWPLASRSLSCLAFSDAASVDLCGDEDVVLTDGRPGGAGEEVRGVDPVRPWKLGWHERGTDEADDDVDEDDEGLWLTSALR